MSSQVTEDRNRNTPKNVDPACMWGLARHYRTVISSTNHWAGKLGDTSVTPKKTINRFCPFPFCPSLYVPLNQPYFKTALLERRDTRNLVLFVFDYLLLRSWLILFIFWFPKKRCEDPHSRHNHFEMCLSSWKTMWFSGLGFFLTKRQDLCNPLSRIRISLKSGRTALFLADICDYISDMQMTPSPTGKVPWVCDGVNSRTH